MTSPHVVAISGSVNRPSKSRALAEAVASAALDRIDMRLSVFDLIDAGPGLGAAFGRDALSPDASAVVDAIESADALIAISPVYKGSYTGLFKHLFDLVDPASLLNKPVVVGATGGGHRHGLVVEHQLRPLFGFFSALTVPSSIYASDHEFAEGKPVDPTVLARIDLAGAQLASLLLSRRSYLLPERKEQLRAASAA
ncbi:FMN reductase [Aquamicrobium sp. LC103]|uniref:FMN reductase n=1 Tax=Aquamicrobium sp. LC103 TaxID=1120658 RepID=UPI00063E7777|nr:FMN reductase [Aquamicrobium sp. LC103]TKT76250.1 FMN reductase [Aquamicrobium sp. LC103]